MAAPRAAPPPVADRPAADSLLLTPAPGQGQVLLSTGLWSWLLLLLVAHLVWLTGVAVLDVIPLWIGGTIPHTGCAHAVVVAGFFGVAVTHSCAAAAVRLGVVHHAALIPAPVHLVVLAAVAVTLRLADDDPLGHILPVLSASAAAPGIW